MGDREVARHTRMAHPRTHSGVAVTAGELPLAPTLYIVNQQNTQKYIKKYTTGYIA